MNMILLALTMIVQNTSPQPNKGPLPADPPPAREMSPAHDLFYEDENKSSPEARAAIQRFGACVAGRSPELASETLRRDFTTRSYRAGLDRLKRANQDCFRRGRMRSSSLLFAGAIAEELLERDRQPLNVRLARVASQPAPPAYSLTDRMAICVVRSVPDETGRLFATEVGSAEEDAAARALAPAIVACSALNRPVQVNSAGLRAILATAAFRSLNGTASAGPA